MTAGEMAQMINGEGWLNGGRKCDLTVVKMEGWKRSMWWDETGLAWVPTSPHVPHAHTTIHYVLTGLLGELGTANQGVGYTLPFELIGAPWVKGSELAAYLNGKNLPGVIFRPMWYKPFYFDTSGIRYEGVQVHIHDRARLDMTQVQIHILAALLRVYPDWNIIDRAKSDRIQMFDKVVGTYDVRRWLVAGMEPDEIVSRLDQARAPFMIKRERYLLYE
jgi:uncharacterized protein YbbC (DUF1343 family)